MPAPRQLSTEKKKRKHTEIGRLGSLIRLNITIAYTHWTDTNASTILWYFPTLLTTPSPTHTEYTFWILLRTCIVILPVLCSFLRSIPHSTLPRFISSPADDLSNGIYLQKSIIIIMIMSVSTFFVFSFIKRQEGALLLSNDNVTYKYSASPSCSFLKTFINSILWCHLSLLFIH